MGKMNVSKHHSIWVHLPTKLSDVLTSLYNTIICIENAWCTYVVLCMHIEALMLFLHILTLSGGLSLWIGTQFFFQHRNFFRCVPSYSNSMHVIYIYTDSLFLGMDIFLQLLCLEKLSISFFWSRNHLQFENSVIDWERMSPHTLLPSIVHPKSFQSTT